MTEKREGEIMEIEKKYGRKDGLITAELVAHTSGRN